MWIQYRTIFDIQNESLDPHFYFLEMKMIDCLNSELKKTQTQIRTQTSNPHNTSSIIHENTLIRDILLNQSSDYYDELVLKQLLKAANSSSSPPETWNGIIQLLQKNLYEANQSSSQSSSSSSLPLASTSASSSTGLNHQKQNKTKQLSLLTLKNDDQKGLVRSKSSSKSSNDQFSNDNDDKNTNLTIPRSFYERMESAINEFPADFMTADFRKNGGFLIHIIIFIYLSIVLAVICDNYFLKSLEYISEALHLPSDIAGATFMAIGTSAPELFTSVIGVFISDNDIGTGTIVGSAVFNLIAIPGACGFAAYWNLRNKPKINPFPIIRDTIFYVLTIITFILCIKDNKVDWIESITLIVLYIVYVIVMYLNAQISHLLGNCQQYSHNRNQSEYDYDDVDRIDEQDRDNLKVSHQSNHNQHNSIIGGNENDELRPLLLSDNSIKRLSPPPAYQSNSISSYGETNDAKIEPFRNRTLDQVDLSQIHLSLTDDGKFKEIVQSNRFVSKSTDRTDRNEIDLEKSTSIESIEMTDWADYPLIQILLIPFKIIFFITLPKPTRFCFVITFVCSICWIACLTYFIVWMVTLVGFTLGIPDTVSGITVLAAGTSIPELISSYLIVKKAGLADMAICNSIGSNIFDILFCLGLPWLLKCSIVIMTNGFGLATLASSYIPIQSTALPITSLTLLVTIGAMIVVFKTSQWRLNLRLGISCLVVYVVFVITSTSLELNI
ncbi:Sodium/potassium/calcium exchanger 3 [Sarcoptes scabiei]|uniref:Sodium/potassium/calcium exchanger 3 n=2 Tax=Sarcoptes scabiei TaxID=52283 RepID=A0A834RD49_SARSC|nr:Sodium/potassium/calcium exchanger 3 [Sarcoptes scabiei]